MNINLPPIADVRAELEALSHADVQELSRISTVPFTTLWKIKDGTTKNPGIETVRLFYPLIKGLGKPADHADGVTQLPAFDGSDRRTPRDQRKGNPLSQREGEHEILAAAKQKA